MTFKCIIFKYINYAPNNFTRKKNTFNKLKNYYSLKIIFNIFVPIIVVILINII